MATRVGGDHQVSPGQNHDIFSLESSELGYTHSTKHVIKVTNDTPFKE